MIVSFHACFVGSRNKTRRLLTTFDGNQSYAENKTIEAKMLPETSRLKRLEARHNNSVER